MPHDVVTDARRRAVRTFHGRTGRLGPASQRAMHELLPLYGIQSPSLASAFPEEIPVVVELGSGMGEATVQMAASEPDVGIVAVEVHTAGVAALLRRVHTMNLSNVRVVHGDGVRVLDEMTTTGSLAGVRAWFPDPWPKGRHHKRRLIRPDLSVLMADRLAAGATLHAATDWADYAEQMVEVLDATPGMANTADKFAPRPDWRPLTRFERKGLAKGHTVHDVIFRKV